MKHHFFFSLLMMAFMFGCQPSSQYNSEIEQLDSLIEITQKNLAQIKNYSVEKSARSIEKLKPYSDFFKNDEGKNYPKELYTGPLSKLSDFERSLNKWMYNRDQLWEQGNRNLEQMQSLKHDLEHNLLDTVKAKEYVEQEIRSFNRWNGTFEKRFPRAKASFDNLDEFLVEIDSIKQHYENLE